MKILYWLIGIGVVAGGAYYFTTRGPQDLSPASGNNSTTEFVEGQQSLADLFASGRSVKCTYTDTVDGQNVVGTVYVGGGKMRADTDINAQGRVMKAHVIFDGQYAYAWVDGIAQGSKFAMDASLQTSSNANASFDAQKKIDYSCSPWVVNSSQFAVPSSVSFFAIGGSASGSGQFGGTPNCSMCDSLPASNQAQCRAALKCQ